MQSDLVNSAVLCWVTLLSTCNQVNYVAPETTVTSTTQYVINPPPNTPVIAPKTGASEVSAQKASTVSQKRTPGYGLAVDNEFITFDPPAHPLILGKSYELRIHLKESKLQYVLLDQTVPVGFIPRGREHAVLQEEHVLQDSYRVPVQYKNGEAYVAITPLRLGKVEMRIFGAVPNGPAFSRSFSVFVDEPNELPSRVMTPDGFTAGEPLRSIHLSVESSQESNMNLSAVYAGVPTPVFIDPRFVHFRITAEDAKDVISLNPARGSITTQHTGRAIVESTYRGFTIKTCVVVDQTVAQANADRSECSELLSTKH